GARGRGRLRVRARPGPEGLGRRAQARGRDGVQRRAAGRARRRPARPLRRRRARRRSRGGALADVPDRAPLTAVGRGRSVRVDPRGADDVGLGRAAAPGGGRRPRAAHDSRPQAADAHRRGLPRLGRPGRIAERRVRRRRRVDARAALLAAVRAPVAAGLRPRGARRVPRQCRAARPRRDRSFRAAARRRGVRSQHAVGQARLRDRRSRPARAPRRRSRDRGRGAARGARSRALQLRAGGDGTSHHGRACGRRPRRAGARRGGPRSL
ncbi:MAG: hypothetical protein AVDCRST_MAG85-1582, partial [uncultured Solirubrobacteraceae bacterium]